MQRDEGEECICNTLMRISIAMAMSQLMAYLNHQCGSAEQHLHSETAKGIVTNRTLTPSCHQMSDMSENLPQSDKVIEARVPSVEGSAMSRSCNTEGARGGDADGGGLPPSWDQPCDLLQMEIQVWRARGVRGQATSVAGG
jgi:hypothetical protein